MKVKGKKGAAKPTKAALSLQLFHEFNKQGQHRLVLIKNGVADNSAWFEPHQLGHFKGYFFCDWPLTRDSPLKCGVWRQTMQPSQILPQVRNSNGPDKAFEASIAVADRAEKLDTQ